MTAAAPLGSVRVHSAHITERHSSVTLLVDESPELRAWLWDTDRIQKGKSLGDKFRLTVDGVTVEGVRVFSRPWCSIFRQRAVTVTSGPGDTRIAALGRKVGKTAHAAELVRVKVVDKRQGKLPAVEPSGPKRVTVDAGNLLPDNPSESTISP